MNKIKFLGFITESVITENFYYIIEKVWISELIMLLIQINTFTKVTTYY